MKNHCFLLLMWLALASLAPAQVVRTLCASGCNYNLLQLQQAINDAQPGWIIEIEAGQTATTAFGLILKNKGTADGPYITLRSSQMSQLPQGKRVTPADKPKLATITYTNVANGQTMTAEQGTGFYRFEGIEFTLPAGSNPFNMIQFGTIVNGNTADSQISQLTHDIVFDRCYIHGHPNQNGPRRGILVNTQRFEMYDSWVEEVKSNDSESQAIAGFNTTGPFYFRNNRISASGISSLFGGAPPLIRGIRATGLFFQGNHYYRPWTHRSNQGTSNPTGACLWDSTGGEFFRNTANNTYWQCVNGTWTAIAQSSWSGGFLQKNQFEYKNAAQSIVEGNLIENGWSPGFQSQHGAGILINQVDNSAGFAPGTGAPSATIMNITFRHNKVRNTPWGISMGILGQYDIPVHDIVFENNLFYNIGAEPQSNNDVVGLQTTATGSLRYSHNTLVVKRASGGRPVSMDAGPTDMVGYYGNIVGWNSFGFNNNFSGSGNLWNAIDTAWNQNRMFSRNVVVNDQNKTAYGDPHPKVNIDRKADSGRSNCLGCGFAPAWTDVGFVNFNNDDYRLQPGSAWRYFGPEGKDPGADIEAVDWATRNSLDGNFNPFFDFLIRAVEPLSTSADITYTAYDTDKCRLTVSDRFDYVNPVWDVLDAGGDQDRKVTVTNLEPNKRYYYALYCGVQSYRRSGVLLTRP